MTGSAPAAFDRAQGRGWIAIAGVLGAVSVLGGAFAAHGLDPNRDAKAISWLHTASVYGAIHALALLAVAALSAGDAVRGAVANWAQRFFTVGSLFFCGALYGLALSGPLWLGAIAPIGGTAFVLGWLTLALAALRSRV